MNVHHLNIYALNMFMRDYVWCIIIILSANTCVIGVFLCMRKMLKKVHLEERRMRKNEENRIICLTEELLNLMKIYLIGLRFVMCVRKRFKTHRNEIVHISTCKNLYNF